MNSNGVKSKRDLPCVLSHEEKGELGIKAAEFRHKAVRLKEEASKLDKESKVLEEEVSTGIVKRQVECIEIKDFPRNEVRVERCDESAYWPKDENGEGVKLVERRAMTGEEKQTMIFDTEAKGEKVVVPAPPEKSSGKTRKQSELK